MPVQPIKPYDVNDIPHLIDAIRDRCLLTEQEASSLRHVCRMFHTDAITEQLVRNLVEALQNPSER